MPRMIVTLALALTATAAACDRASNRAADTTLNTDLSLAAQQRGYQPLDSLSAAERATAGAAATRSASSAGSVARRHPALRARQRRPLDRAAARSRSTRSVMLRSAPRLERSSAQRQAETR